MDMISTLMPLAPVIIVSLTAVLVMLLVAIKRHHDLIATATVIGLNAAVAYIVWQALGKSLSMTLSKTSRVPEPSSRKIQSIF